MPLGGFRTRPCPCLLAGHREDVSRKNLICVRVVVVTVWSIYQTCIGPVSGMSPGMQSLRSPQSPQSLSPFLPPVVCLFAGFKEVTRFRPFGRQSLFPGAASVEIRGAFRIRFRNAEPPSPLLAHVRACADAACARASRDRHLAHKGTHINVYSQPIKEFRADFVAVCRVAQMLPRQAPL